MNLIYQPITEGFSDYVEPKIVIEFGARSTGGPANAVLIRCDADFSHSNVTFPEIRVRAMTPERTFWEKATAVHFVCSGGRTRGRKAFSRHFYDLLQLDRHGYANRALGDQYLANEVAKHKSLFF